MPVRSLLAVLVGLLALITPYGVRGEVMRWRYPGVSGLWLDPHNWIGETSGLPRVPGPNDDVVLTGYNLIYGSTFTVILQTRGAPVRVKSLTVGSSACLPCEYSYYFYIYDGASESWQTINLSGDTIGRCGVALRIVAPTRLEISGAFSMDWEAVIPQLQLASFVDRAAWRSAISAGSYHVNRGEIYGTGDIYGSLTNFAGSLHVVTVLPSGLFPTQAAQKAGILNVFGDLNLASAVLNVYVNYAYPYYSQVRVSQHVTFSKYIVMRGGLLMRYGYNPELPIVVFNSSGPANLNVETTPDNDYTGGLVNPWLRCRYSLPSTQYNPVCSKSSAHEMSVLVGAQPSVMGCCPSGYSGWPDCVPICPGEPACNNRGRCSPPECICWPGWTGFACEIPDCPGSPLECSANGRCVAPLPLGSARPYCDCDDGWGGNDCSVPLCPNNCTGADHGTCNTQGNAPKCICKAGYMLGPDLDCAAHVPVCPGLVEECSGHGSCNNSKCRCDAGWTGADCSLAVCPKGCNHHGTCVENSAGTGTRCACSPGWSGADCSVPSCNNGAGCSGHGYCSPDLDPPRCICNAPTTLPTSTPPSPAVAADFGWSGPACANGSVPDCAFSGCTSNGGTCGSDSQGRTCLVNSCPPGRTGWDCAEYFCADTGYPECNGHGMCQGPDSPACTCRPGYLLGEFNDCQFAECEVNGCSGHGKCRTDLATPTCECDPYFYGPDCSITICPGYPAPCSGSNGECQTNGSCICNSEWEGLDCSVAICPTTNGRYCNGRGSCNSSTSPFHCDCEEGFTGFACQKAICPNSCSGHGICDGSLSPPACRCDPYYSGADCSAKQEADTEEWYEDVQNIVIYSLSGAGLLLMPILMVTAAVIFVLRKRKKHRRLVKSMQITSNMLQRMQREEQGAV